MIADSSFFDAPTSPFDEESIGQRLRKIISPADASDLVPKMSSSPPDSAPAHQPGQSTPLTGSLDYAPREAIPKNLDTQAGRGSYNVQPAQPLQQPLRPYASPMAGGLPSQPLSTGTTANGLKTVVRDLNGNPAGSFSSTMPAQPGGGSTAMLQPTSGLANNVSPVRPAQPGLSPIMPANTGRLGVQPVVPQPVQPGNMGLQPAVKPAAYQPGVPLATQQGQRVQAYNFGPGPSMFAASQSPVSTDPLNPDPTSSLRPGGSTVMPATARDAPTQVQGPSQLDLAQNRLSQLTNNGPGWKQIQNPIGRVAAGVGDAALSAVLPGIAPLIGGTTAHNQQLIGREQGIVGNLQGQQQAAAQLADTQSQTQERQALADKADKYDPNITRTVTTADGVMAFNPSTGRYDNRVGDAPDKLNKYQIITAGDGTMFRVDPADPTHAEPITGPDGKQLTGKQESKYIQLERGGVEHTIEVGAGGKQTDLGPTGQKPMRVSVNGGGTWALDEDKNGKPILFNSKTGETKDAPDVQKAGTAAKAQAAIDKVNEPVDAAMNYANDYLTRGTYTGSGDEALQEKFFELAKPSVGFRMTQPQIDLLQNSRSWINSAAAHLRHATTGTWFSDTQRKEIVQTMKDLGAAKKKSGGASQPAPSSKPGGFEWSSHPKVQP